MTGLFRLLFNHLTVIMLISFFIDISNASQYNLNINAQRCKCDLLTVWKISSARENSSPFPRNWCLKWDIWNILKDLRFLLTLSCFKFEAKSSAARNSVLLFVTHVYSLFSPLAVNVLHKYHSFFPSLAVRTLISNRSRIFNYYLGHTCETISISHFRASLEIKKTHVHVPET